jgi:hypothetical protein
MIEDGLTLQGLIFLGAHRALRGLADPILLIKSCKDSAAPVVFDTPHPGHPLLDTNSAVEPDGSLSGYVDPDTMLVPLRKTRRNNFPNFITLGRASNNDLIIADKTVSKVHGWFLIPEGSYSMWRFYDNGSTNGTSINGNIIPPNSATFIRPGDELCLGNIRMLFMESEDAGNLCYYAKIEWDRSSKLGFPKEVDTATIRVDHGTANSTFQKISL